MDTIFALATPPGRGGIAVVRVSGAGAGSAVEALTGRDVPAARMAILRALRAADGKVIDNALVIFFPGPRSFTGEDVAEFHVHGGRAVVDALLAALAALPSLRLAEAGEFTRRAFENGRIDLTAAEAVADLIDAETEAQREQALAQMGGALARLYDGWRDRLARVLAHVEADIDFPDEDLPDGVAAEIRPQLAALEREIRAHLNDGRRGEMLRDGVRVAVLGAPNAGKSSLVNALSRREVAIVSPHAGTTRDVIEAHLNLSGYPVILADTAGLREAQGGAHGEIEREGMRRAHARAAEADIKLLVFDASAPPDEATLALKDERALIVANKIDVLTGHPRASGDPELDVIGATLDPRLRGDATVGVVARDGKDLSVLIDALTAKIKSLIGDRQAAPLTRERHRAALEDCAASLTRALEADAAELLAEDTRLAIRALGRITGRVDVEDLLDIIFRDFCIGK